MKIENIIVKFEGTNKLNDLVKEYVIYELNIENSDCYALDKNKERIESDNDNSFRWR